MLITSRSVLPSSILAIFALCFFVTSPVPAEDVDVPQGKITAGEFADSEIFPGTTRPYKVYVPAQYDSSQPASLMVFMDGLNYARPNGAFNVPTVFDRLIHEKKMPVTVAVFVNPGTIAPTMEGAKGRSNRSFEYDSLGDRYARFLTEEFLPVALKGINVSSNSADRAVCGISSGGICAFTVAWEMSGQFGKVMSHIGSFTNIRGGWAYPGLIRKTKDDPKPIKVYLQEGKDDLSNLHGSWPLGNRDVAAALQFAGYHYRLQMTEGGHGGKWAGEVFPEAVKWLWDEESEATHVPNPATKPAWAPHPDAIAKDGVPQGTVTSMEPWKSKIFENTIRDWAIYVPAQYNADKPAALMVFQDGERMRDIKGRWRIPTVFDNLIASGEMPVTIGVFLNPGHDISKPRKGRKSSNRGFEYDSLGDRYSRFLLEEILPEVQKQYNITDDPNLRAIGGSSSGAICAFTTAWERPGQFRKVYSNVGSFTHLRGGNIYPALVRKTEPKPIRVYMADTSGDIDNAFGSWPWANQRMASALDYMGYDHKFVWAEGYAHNADFGSSKFPDAMRWLWRSEGHTPEYDTTDDLRGDLTLLNLLVPGEDWELVADDFGFADALCSDSKGNLYFCDMKAPAVYRLDAETGERTVIAKESVSGLELNADESVLYACQGKQQRVIRIDVASGDVRSIATDVQPNDLEVTSDGWILITETRKHQVTAIHPETGETKAADVGITRPNGIALSNDGGTLGVSDAGGQHAWTFRVNANGVLDAKHPTMPLRRPIDPKGEFRFNQEPPYVTASRGDGMAVDSRGRYYVTSSVGVQVFDPTGRPCGVISRPDQQNPLTSCMLAGPDHSTLYVAQGSKLFRRKLTVQKSDAK